eukprot:9141087-Pyramimonas_sp.AAC.1
MTVPRMFRGQKMVVEVGPSTKTERCREIVRNLKLLGAPTLLVNLTLLTFLRFNVGSKTSFVEHFAGDAELSRALQEDAGLKGFSFDIKYDEDAQDINSAMGFINQLAAVCDVKPAGPQTLHEKGCPSIPSDCSSPVV